MARGRLRWGREILRLCGSTWCRTSQHHARACARIGPQWHWHAQLSRPSPAQIPHRLAAIPTPISPHPFASFPSSHHPAVSQEFPSRPSHRQPLGATRTCIRSPYGSIHRPRVFLGSRLDELSVPPTCPTLPPRCPQSYVFNPSSIQSQRARTMANAACHHGMAITCAIS